MARVALRGLAGRKLRAALTALAIVLGVAMVSGTYVLTDTIDRAFDTIFDRSYAGTDAVVSAAGEEVSFQGLTAETPGVPAELLDDVRAVESVDSATGSVADESAAKILDREGKAIDTQGAPALGFGIDSSPELSHFNPLNLVAGRWPSAGNEVVIDAATADAEAYDVGDTVRVASLAPVRAFRLVGIAQFAGVNSLGTATFAVFDLPTAQQLFDRKGEFDGISAAAKEGVSPEQLVRDLRAALPASVKVQTGAQQADDDRAEVAEFTSFIRYFLLAFGGIALFVGAFVIFNSLSITVAQRAREFATLRTIGASRRQVLGSVVLEALVVGILASIVGLLLGFALAYGIDALFRTLGFDLPATDMVFATRTILVALLVGIGVTLVAGLFPAIRATRVPPLAAVREGATLPRSRFAPFTPFVSVVVVVLSLGLLAYAMFADDLATGRRLLAIALGTVGLFIGVGLLSPRFVRPLARVVGEPALRLGGAAGSLARGNATRNPGRTAATAAALMIGLALATFVATLADGMKASNRDAIEAQIAADYVVTSQSGFEPFVAAAVLSPARQRQHREGDVRHPLRAPAEPVHLREHPRRAVRRLKAPPGGGRRRLPRREGADARGVDHGPG